ncbi:MAG: single-stranded-DNA-specific exonuclease RecJ [Desulfuromonas sp.]|uniref:single-stranded-DNA-specific exonuclease RecJ n=1 Tax=Desulfuromonas sp. TaxID=892 RepID=UPI000CB8D30D|nr:single-stranded-DNA-specific exonuclease RecJ [Desulfuromonas sp.]PLX85121.1 MAG: single-stranded-DNA-specific exonuclease RecJ [Desulfuromonas sp.]
MTQRRWVTRGERFGEEALAGLRSRLEVGSLTAEALLRRGITTAEAGRAFLQSRLAHLPDPSGLAGIDRAVARLVKAIEGEEAISVHGDYDVDGVTGTALLVEILRAFGGRVDYHIPERLKDGYGLSGQALKDSAMAGTRVVVSVDCGISAIEEAELAASLGLDLIITDHHQPPPGLPRAYALVNPHLDEGRTPFQALAGVGVAFFLLIALRKVLRERGWFVSRPEPDLRLCLDLVALGTVADLVPLTGVNRTMVKAGLSVLSGGERVGIEALKEVSGVKEVSSGNVGFQLAPRLNAAGRLVDAGRGVELLLTRSADEARSAAQDLDALNQERRRIEAQTLEQALERLEGEGAEGLGRSIVLADARWHSGVIGIVASRLVERYYRPTVLISLENGRGKGSARSISGFHLYRAFDQCRDHLLGFGGHAYAAGLTIESGQVGAFADRLEEEARDALCEEDLHQRIVHDGEVALDTLSFEAVSELQGLAPFGMGNPEPAFVARGVEVERVRKAGQQHLAFDVRQGGVSLPCIAFGLADRQAELSGPIDLLFAPSLNRWRGRSSVQLKVKDWRPGECGD